MQHENENVNVKNVFLIVTWKRNLGSVW
jgi:hypothetical protein